MASKIFLWFLGLFGGLLFISWLDVKQREKKMEKLFLQTEKVPDDPMGMAGDGFSVLRAAQGFGS